jgi:hypothetical protein
MRSEKEFERLLESALTQKVEPDADIQRKVLAQWKEKRNMNQKKWSIAVAAAACVLVATVSVGATTHYLNSRDVAQELGYDKIAKVFEEQEAIEINETQSYGGYEVTLMGVVRHMWWSLLPSRTEHRWERKRIRMSRIFSFHH